MHTCLEVAQIESVWHICLYKCLLYGQKSNNILWIFFKQILFPDSLVIWSVQKKEAICGSPASARSAGNPTTLVFSMLRDEMVISAGKYGFVFLGKASVPLK